VFFEEKLFLYPDQFRVISKNNLKCKVVTKFSGYMFHRYLNNAVSGGVHVSEIKYILPTGCNSLLSSTVWWIALLYICDILG
jgi:hypothetical protein